MHSLQLWIGNAKINLFVIAEIYFLKEKHPPILSASNLATQNEPFVHVQLPAVSQISTWFGFSKVSFIAL